LDWLKNKKKEQQDDSFRHDGVEELFQQYRADVLTLQEAPYGLVELLREDGYIIMETMVCCERFCTPWFSSKKQNKSNSNKKQKLNHKESTTPVEAEGEESLYDVADARHRVEIYNVIAVREDAIGSNTSDPRQLHVVRPFMSPIILSRCKDRNLDTDDGPVVVEESRQLQYI
jgi:hypothetical protein